MGKDVAAPACTLLVYVIDDDPAVCSSLKFSLEIEGFAVRAFADPNKALNDGDDLSRCACLVIDYNLPGMNGLDLLEQMRKRNVSAPAILITSHPDAKLVRRAEAAHARLVEKPFLENLADVMRAMLPPGR